MGYERHFGDIIAHSWSISENDWSFDLVDVLAILHSYDQRYAIANWAYWKLDVNIEFQIRTISRCVFLRCNFVNMFAVSPQQPCKFFVGCLALWPSHENCWLLFFPSPSLFAYYSSLFLEHRAGASKLLPLAITVYCDFSVMRFLFIARNGAVDYQCFDSSLLLSSRKIFIPFLACFRTHVHDYGIRHPIHGSAFGYRFFPCRFNGWLRYTGRHGTLTTVGITIPSCQALSMMYQPVRSRRTRGSPVVISLQDVLYHCVQYLVSPLGSVKLCLTSLQS